MGYYRDSGPAEMSEEVLRQLKAFEAQPPPPKHLNDTGGILTVGEEEGRSYSLRVGERTKALMQEMIATCSNPARFEGSPAP